MQAVPAQATATDNVITANRLRDGVVVWRGRAGTWVEPFEEAELHSNESAGRALQEAERDAARQLVVGVYKVAVSVRDGRAAPENVREAIRSHGPSVRRDLGIQAREARTAR